MFTEERRSEIMARITGKDTKPELIVRRILHALGFRFRLHRADLPGKPDVVLPKLNTVVFVHGCFWHGHDCRRGSKNRRPKSNESYWLRKLDRNLARDAEHEVKLTELGWRRIVVWECETVHPESLARWLLAELRPSSTTSKGPVRV